MDKVWFKLRQTHYPPGPEESILAGEGDDSQAPICLGHCIPDLRHIDFPINSGDIKAFPTRINVFLSQAINFKWDETRGTGHHLSLSAGSPVAVAAGLLTASASIRLAFKKTVEHHEAYERLDTYIFQPNRQYVEDCLKTQSLKKYVDGRFLWSFFMITGIRVARVGKRSTEESSGAEIDGGPQVYVSDSSVSKFGVRLVTFCSEIPVVATADATGGVKREHAQKMEGEVSDFVWAVRLAKVHKGLLMRDWSVGPYTHKATLSLGKGEQVDVAKVVESEGLGIGTIVVSDEELGEAIVIDADKGDFF
ncbi:hypothetical protein N0V82_009348 [Gnomoniopsis sp. IMI 355080]|nr:hypothetical protein N0V82_009348 [Gnomoniopsis sp. IMI 355080]